MKKIIILLGFIFICSIQVNAQINYFYYYQGKKQYLELDTKHIFVSVADKNMIDMVEPNIKKMPILADIPEKVQSRNNRKRFWTRLSIENDLSDNLYLVKLSEMRKNSKGTTKKQSGNFNIQLYNKSGSLIRSFSANTTVMQLNVADLPNDIYFLHINGLGDKPEIRTIIISH
jgi:hypothetical protein